MTDCNTNPLPFSSLGSRKIQADFNGGSLTSDAGALLLRELDKRIGLIDAINNCIPDPRNPLYTVHQQKTMLAQRIFGEFAYAADTWDCRRRVIVKAEHLEQGANTRFIVTNLEGEPQKLYDEVYCRRGEAENRIKEQQCLGHGLSIGVICRQDQLS